MRRNDKTGFRKNKKPQSLSPPRKHHYLPKAAYLKFFELPGCSGKVYLYRKDANGPILTSVNNVGVEKDLYRAKDKNGNTDFSIETELFGVIDSCLISLISKLNLPFPAVQLEPNISLLYSEFIDLCMYVSYQMMRVPGNIETLANIYGDMAKQVNLFLAQNKEYWHKSWERASKKIDELAGLNEEEIEKTRKFAISGEYDIEVENTSYFLGQALEHARDSIPGFLTKKLIILKTPSGKQFITSDYPVLKIPDSKIPIHFRGGILGSHLYIPIGSGTALYFLNEKELRPISKYLNKMEHIPVIFISREYTDQLNRQMVLNAENSLIAGFKDNAIFDLFKKQVKIKRYEVFSPFSPRT